MVKPDIKHNYYADLGLPAAASIEDVRKAYHRLALLYHPDRNAGREEECIPRFQAIQAANEILSDATVKAKYDLDRRRTGLDREPVVNSTANSNPYQAYSAYPPPPRRTQPPTWQKAQSSGASPNGADRFTNFPRPSPTARKDNAQDRANMFRAWQNMNNPQDRQGKFTSPGQTPPQPQPQPTQSQYRARTRTQAAPRNDTDSPFDERIRAGMSYRRAPPNIFQADAAESRQSAWAAFQQANADMPGISRTNTARTPKKNGFNPNAPGSDERAAPTAGSNYAHRHKSEDLGRSDRIVPPPPANTPQNGTPTPRPVSAKAPIRSRTFDEDPPFTEGNRRRTPYSTFIGEKTAFHDIGQIPRSFSSRDTSKLNPQESSEPSRARSNSPQPRTRTVGDDRQKAFVIDSSSENDSEEEAQSATSAGGHTGYASANNTTAQSSRKFEVPARPSKGRPIPPYANRNSATGDTGSGGVEQDVKKDNMYENPSISDTSSTTTFDRQAWLAAMIGSNSTSRAPLRQYRVGNWILPISSYTRRNETTRRNAAKQQRNKAFVTAADKIYVDASIDEQAAYLLLQTEVRNRYGYVPHNLDMDIFFKLVSNTCRLGTTGHEVLDELLQYVLATYPSVRLSPACDIADESLHKNSFTFSPSGWSTDVPRSMGEERINMNFSTTEWNGTFIGKPHESVSPNDSMRKAQSPSKTTRPKARSPQRESTLGATSDPPSPKKQESSRLRTSNGVPKISVDHVDTTDSSAWGDHQENIFSPAWMFGGAKPMQTTTASDVKNGSASTRDQALPDGNTNGLQSEGYRATEHEDQPARVRNDNMESSVADVGSDGDDMDVDPPQPIYTNSSGVSPEKHSRVHATPYSTSDDFQSRPQKMSNVKEYQTDNTSEDNTISPTLDGLRNVEPIATANGGVGLSSLADLSTFLPFQSGASSTLFATTPRSLQIPPVPKVPDLPVKLTASSWPAYVQKFGAYLKAYHNFDTAILQHFVAREALIEQRFSAGMGFLEASGETSAMQQNGGSSRGGYASYLQGVEEDVRVREAWNVGCEKHVEAVRKFASLREQVRRLVAAGGLAVS